MKNSRGGNRKAFSNWVKKGMKFAEDDKRDEADVSVPEVTQSQTSR